MATMATKQQIAKVQVVYAQLAKREVGVENNRETRLQWASKLLNREVISFSSLKRGEAIHLIDQAQGALGVAFVPHKLSTRSEARRAGLDGRHDGEEFAAQPQLAAATEIELIQGFYTRLGWSRAQFDSWLASPRSPLRGKQRIVTTADANKVRWALKGMLKAQGLWEAA